MRKRWLLPETPDVLGLLRAQVAVTIDGVDAFAAWAGGDAAAADVVRDAEHRGDAAKRALLRELRAAFVTPMEPEDVFALSRGIDRILDYARDLVVARTAAEFVGASSTLARKQCELMLKQASVLQSFAQGLTKPGAE